MKINNCLCGKPGMINIRDYLDYDYYWQEIYVGCQDCERNITMTVHVDDKITEELKNNLILAWNYREKVLTDITLYLKTLVGKINSEETHDETLKEITKIIDNDYSEEHY